MEKDRLAAFSDGVIAVIITIMVLDLKIPHGTSLTALATAAPTFVSYILSFVSVAIYWNNHHHFFQRVPRVTGAILRANLHLLFWLSLIPFATAWLDARDTAPIPTALYGLALLVPAIAWYILQTAIIRAQGNNPALSKTIGRDLKGVTSPILDTTGIILTFIDTAVSDALYAMVALLWLIPDRRVEQAIPRED
jgi:uncharacterized membrane protein